MAETPTTPSLDSLGVRIPVRLLLAVADRPPSEVGALHVSFGPGWREELASGLEQAAEAIREGSD